MSDEEMSNKLFVVRSGGHDYLLRDMGREEFLGISCIAGVYYDRKGKAYIKDQLMRIPIERVESIVEFASIDEYHDAVQHYFADQAV